MVLLTTSAWVDLVTASMSFERSRAVGLMRSTSPICRSMFVAFSAVRRSGFGPITLFGLPSSSTS